LKAKIYLYINIFLQRVPFAFATVASFGQKQSKAEPPDAEQEKPPDAEQDK